MDERIQQFRIGVMVLAALLVGAILVVMFGKLPVIGRGTYPLKIVYVDAPGVSPNSPVRRSGILVGRVANVAFDDQRNVVVTVNLNDDFQVRKDEIVRISSTLLGDAELQVVPNKKAVADTTFYSPGDTLSGEVAGNPLNVISNLEDSIKKTIDGLGNTSKSFEKTSDEIREFVERTNKFLENDGDTIKDIVQNTKQATENIAAASKRVETILNDTQFKDALQDAKELFATTRDTIEKLQGTLESVDNIARNIDKFTQPLGTPEAQANLSKIGQTVGKLDTTLAELERFSKQLNSRDGTVGQLLHNPQLYQQLNEAAENINDVSRRLRPIVEDARVLTDRISRNPGIILRDAVQPGPGTKWSIPERETMPR